MALGRVAGLPPASIERSRTWLLVRGPRHPAAGDRHPARLGDRRGRPPAVDRLRADAHRGRHLAGRERGRDRSSRSALFVAVYTLLGALWLWTLVRSSAGPEPARRRRGQAWSPLARRPPSAAGRSAAVRGDATCSTCPTIWFLLIGVLIAGYAVLDGFDLGAGILHLFVAADRRGAAAVIDGHRPGLGRQRGLAADRRRRALRRVPAGLRDGLLRLLPGADAAAGGAHLPGGRPRVPQPGSTRRAGARPGTWPSRVGSARARRCCSAWRSATSCAGCRSTPTASTAAGSLGLLNPSRSWSGSSALALFAMHGRGLAGAQDRGRRCASARCAPGGCAASASRRARLGRGHAVAVVARAALSLAPRPAGRLVLWRAGLASLAVAAWCWLERQAPGGLSMVAPRHGHRGHTYPGAAVSLFPRARALDAGDGRASPSTRPPRRR